MDPAPNTSPSFVIKTMDLQALNRLGADLPRPQRLEWINRGTDQRLRRSTIEMLLRTLSRGSSTQSVMRLHQSSGLRVIFASEAERLLFASEFQHASSSLNPDTDATVAALFKVRQDAERAIVQLHDVGVSGDAMSLLWVADKASGEIEKGHSTASVAGAVAGGGVVGTMLGIGLLAIPGVGPLLGAGAIAASTIPSVSAVIGATGGAIARMLTDRDVDSRDALYYEDEIVDGEVFLLINCQLADIDIETIRAILRARGGNPSEG